MNISIPMILFSLLTCIIPALIVLTVCMLRIETIRGDARAAAEKLASMIGEYSRILSQFTSYTDQLSTLSAGLHAAGMRMTTLDESVTSISNKLSSRERADRLAINRREKQEEEQPPAEIPGTKQKMIDFSKIPGAIPLQQIQPVVPVITERQFGEYPEGW